MRKRDRLQVATAALPVLLALASCAGGGWVRDHPDVADRARAQPGGFVEPARRQWRDVATFGASYTMRVTRGIGSRSFDLYISLRRPDSIDILVLAPTGLGEAYLRANPYQVGMFVLEDRVLYAGPASGDTFARALGFDLGVADAIAVLLGYGADPQRWPTGLATWDDKARRIRIDHGGRVSVWLHPLTSRFDRVEYRDEAGGVSAEVLEWIEVAPAGEPRGQATAPRGIEIADPDPRVALPRLLRLQVQPDGLGLQLRLLGDPAMNLDYADDRFELQFLPGVAVLPIEDLARDGGLFRRSLPDRER